MEQLVKLPSQNTSAHLSYYLPNEHSTPGGIDQDTKGLSRPRTPERLQTQQPKQLGNSSLTITADVLDAFLYGKRKIQEIDIEEAKKAKTAKEYPKKKNENGSIWCENCQSYRNHDSATCSKSCKTLRQLVGNTVHDIKLTYAVLSFPPEVQLCTSTIPGYGYGVCAKQPFPVGTWIGPYEGTRLQAEDAVTKSDTNYIWEIYEDGNFSHFLDGNDESTSSWMRFIRCARHKGEQNMVVFQYGNNIYYRAVRDIPTGVELLVWYNNNYTQFLGVPLGLPTVPGTKKCQSPTSNETLKPGDSPSPLNKEEFKAFLKEQINKSNSKKSTAQVPPNVTISTPGHATVLKTEPQPINGVIPPSPHMIPVGSTIIPQVHGMPQVYPGTPTNVPRMIPGTVNMPPALPQGVNGAMVYTAPISHSTTAIPPATPPYGYNGVMEPRMATMAYMKQEPIPPSPTVDYRPMVTQALHSPSATNPDMQRQQYPPHPHSDNPATVHYSTTQQPPTTSCFTTAGSALQDGRTSPPGDPSVSMKCNQCQQTFNKLSLLQMHMCYKSPDKPFECGHCSQAFATPTELRSHVMSHTNERPFKCGFCGSSFSGAATLNNHMQTHNVERSFRCQKCGQTFSMATQLSRHMRTPGECPMGANADQLESDVTTPYTSTLTRG